MDVSNLRSQFPIFSKHPELAYLDNAATTQKPQAVIQTLVDFYSNNNANVHRGLYPLSNTASEMYEEARHKLAQFINAADNEIVFTSGTTGGINSLALMLISSGLIDRDAPILLTDVEHHSSMLPWRQISQNCEYLPINENYELEITDENDNLTVPDQVYDVVAVSLVSNVTGAIADLKRIRERVKYKYLVVDAAQAFGHMPLDVSELGVDFLVASAHKVYGPTGVGILYGKYEHLAQLEPALVGGGMISTVSKAEVEWAEIPSRFEAGTPPIAEAIAFAAAVEFISQIGFAEISAHEQRLSVYLQEQLNQIPGITLFHPKEAANHAGVFAFAVQGIHPHDLAQILGDNNVAVRAGHHCTHILHKEVLQIPATTRASIALYNNVEDIDKLVAGITHAQDLIK